MSPQMDAQCGNLAIGRSLTRISANPHSGVFLVAEGGYAEPFAEHGGGCIFEEGGVCADGEVRVVGGAEVDDGPEDELAGAVVGG